MFSTNVRTFHKWQHDTNHNFIDKILSVWYKETVAPPPSPVTIKNYMNCKNIIRDHALFLLSSLRICPNWVLCMFTYANAAHTRLHV